MNLRAGCRARIHPVVIICARRCPLLGHICYRISDRGIGRDQATKDQFDTYSLRMGATAMLAVPSHKLRWGLAGG